MCTTGVQCSERLVLTMLGLIDCFFDDHLACFCAFARDAMRWCQASRSSSIAEMGWCHSYGRGHFQRCPWPTMSITSKYHRSGGNIEVMITIFFLSSLPLARRYHVVSNRSTTESGDWLRRHHWPGRLLCHREWV